MIQELEITLTPKLARKLLVYDQLKKLNFSDELYNIAVQDMISISDDTQRDFFQYLYDFDLRTLILGSSKEKIFKNILSYLEFNNKYPILIVFNSQSSLDYYKNTFMMDDVVEIDKPINELPDAKIFLTQLQNFLKLDDLIENRSFKAVFIEASPTLENNQFFNLPEHYYYLIPHLSFFITLDKRISLSGLFSLDDNYKKIVEYMINILNKNNDFYLLLNNSFLKKKYMGKEYYLDQEILYYLMGVSTHLLK